MGVGVAGVANYVNTSSGTASDVVAYGGVGGPYEYCSFFSVLNWFLKGEPGAWYDPSDFQPNWRRNLLTYSQDFANAAWSKAGVSNGPFVSAPDGTITGVTGLELNTLANHTYYQSITSAVLGTVYTTSGYVKKHSRKYAVLGFAQSSDIGSGVQIDLDTGLIVYSASAGGYSITNSSCDLIGDGWYRVSLSGKVGASTCYPFLGSGGDTLMTTGLIYSATNQFQGDVVKGVYVWHPQLEQSSSASTYQKITDGIQDYYTVQPQPVLFQDSAGTIPVTAVEQPVGLMLDKSKGLALGAELVTNGSFTTDTGWTKGTGWTITGGQGVLTAGAGILQQAMGTVVVGTSYTVSINTNLAIQLRVGSANIGYFNPVNNTILCFITAIAGALIEIIPNGTQTGYVDNISVKQIAGNHAFQGDSTSTPAKRPMLSARVNLLTKTEDFSATWLLGNNTANLCTVTNVSNTNPLGVTTLISKIDLPAVSTGNYSMVYLPIAVISTEYTASIYLKGLVGGENVYLMLTPDGTSFGSVQCTLTTSWQKFTVPKTSSSTLLYYQVGVDLRNSTQSAKPAQSFYAWGADLRPTNSGALLPAYQRVNTASDYDTVGFPLYLKANGTSSAMSTNSIDFTATDKMTVVTGVRNLIGDASKILMELSASGGNTGIFAILNPRALNVNFPNISYTSGGTTVVDLISTNVYIAPYSSVITGQSSIPTPISTIRVNGGQIASSSATQGSGTFGNYPLYLFARAGTSLFLNGQFYGAIIRGAQSDTASVTQTENYMAQKTGITF